jgi:hypothetical protein
LPALRTFAEYQDIAVNQLWRPIYRRVLQNAIDAGLLPEQVQEHDNDGEPMFEEVENDEPLTPGAKPKHGPAKMIDTLDAFDLSAPDLESDDPKTMAEALAIDLQNGWVSNETAAGVRGYDYRSEQKKIEREEKQAQTKMYQGGAPVLGRPLPAVADDPDEEEAPPAKAQPAQESYQPINISPQHINITTPAPVVTFQEAQQQPPSIYVNPTPVIVNPSTAEVRVQNQIDVQPAEVKPAPMTKK